jgi:predicted enzyme related to lactoylglutathione lyase
LTDGGAAAARAGYPRASGAAPRWDVTFAVSDTDDTARQAADLGGSVLVAPYDAGPARIAVLADPQGATFTVSRYDPG